MVISLNMGAIFNSKKLKSSLMVLEDANLGSSTVESRRKFTRGCFVPAARPLHFRILPRTAEMRVGEHDS